MGTKLSLVLYALRQSWSAHCTGPAGAALFVLQFAFAFTKAVYIIEGSNVFCTVCIAIGLVSYAFLT
jgi:hypothetical protein